MRVKSEEKRQAILRVATEVFEAQGFEAASMAQIAAQVGGSKGTLYSYFASKEELFVEVMLILAQNHKKQLEGFACDSSDIRQTLHNFGMVYLSFISKPFYLDMYRTIIGFKNNPDVRRQFYEKGPGKGHLRIAALMEQAQKEGQLAEGDASVMAHQFKALLDAEVLQKLLLGMMEQPSAANIQPYVSRACESFLHIYGKDAKTA